MSFYGVKVILLPWEVKFIRIINIVERSMVLPFDPMETGDVTVCLGQYRKWVAILGLEIDKKQKNKTNKTKSTQRRQNNRELLLPVAVFDNKWKLNLYFPILCIVLLAS